LTLLLLAIRDACYAFFFGRFVYGFITRIDISILAVVLEEDNRRVSMDLGTAGMGSHIPRLHKFSFLSFNSRRIWLQIVRL